jgi:hypothetical protein
MSSGFNTDVACGQRVFHVQTEDRGPSHPSIDTVVYQNGRILHRHSTNYEKLAASGEFTAEMLRERVENQHRELIESLRAGELDAEIAAAEEKAVAAGIQVQLLNPTSWLAGGRVLLEVVIVRRVDSQPVSGARIQALIDGALAAEHHTATSDELGHATIEFELPPLGKGDLALVIEAESNSSKDGVRFAMRSRAKSPAAGSA